MSRSTLVRRRKLGRLDAQESDRLLRYARLYTQAEGTFGDAESFTFDPRLNNKHP